MRWIGMAAFLAAVAGGVILLREETMTTHVPTPTGSVTWVVVEAATQNAGPSASERELARAVVSTCRLQVASGLVGDGLGEIGPHTYDFRLTPALDESDRRQLRGCLEDIRVDHVQLEVVRLVDSLP